MGELVPGSFGSLIARAFEELERNQSIFTLSARKFSLPSPDLDTSVAIHGRRAASPLGPSAGPHTQMAQNIVLSWLAGSRVVELKTVQILDSLKIPRPCIDARRIGFNVEWSQELKLEQSLEEYVKASMLIEMLAQMFGVKPDCVFDLSVGYDLAGIRSESMRAFLNGMIDATHLVDTLRLQIPRKWSRYRDLDFTTNIARSVTLSTFHGCPPTEIEQIADYLMSDLGLDCTIKLNPTLLGQKTVEDILHGRLQYTGVRVPESAFQNDPPWDDAVEMVRRLRMRASQLGRGFAIKLTNTLVVENHSDFLPSTEKLAYLSGRPLHVLAMHLVRRFRRELGATLPISFSAGIDRQNYPDAVALGLAPVTVCTDLLQQGGYGRLKSYVAELERRMASAGAKTLDEFILSQSAAGNVPAAIMSNTDAYIDRLDHDFRYRADPALPPRKSGRKVTLFDCATCDLCIAACPNAAIFTLPREGTHRHLIAVYAQWCNDCGNCETFCPDVGAPNHLKPRIFSDENAWRADAPRPGFFISRRLALARGEERHLNLDNVRRAVYDPSYVNSLNCLLLENS